MNTDDALTAGFEPVKPPLPDPWLVPPEHRPTCPLDGQPCTSWTCLVDVCVDEKKPTLTDIARVYGPDPTARYFQGGQEVEMPDAGQMPDEA